MMSTVKLTGLLAVAALFGVVGCASSAAPATHAGRSLSDVSPELLQQASGEKPSQFVEVDWRDVEPEKVEAKVLPQTRATRSQTFTRSHKNQIFVAPNVQMPTDFTSTNKQ
jgi:hypothetical protein